LPAAKFAAIAGWLQGHCKRGLCAFALRRRAQLLLGKRQSGEDRSCGSLKPHLAKLLRRAMLQMPLDHADVLNIREVVTATDAAASSAIA
jgi:hypothetical protein